MLTHSSHPRAWFHYSQWESLLLAGSFKNWVQIWFFLGLLLRLFSLEGLLEPPDKHGRGNPVLFFIPITGALFWWELSGRRWWWRLTSYQEGTRRPFSSSMFSVCLPSLSAKSLSGSVTSKGWLLYGEPIHQAWKQYTEQPVALPHHTALSLYKLPFEHVSHEMCKNMGMIFFLMETGLLVCLLSLTVATFFGRHFSQDWQSSKSVQLRAVSFVKSSTVVGKQYILSYWGKGGGIKSLYILDSELQKNYSTWQCSSGMYVTGDMELLQCWQREWLSVITSEEIL